MAKTKRSTKLQAFESDEQCHTPQVRTVLAALFFWSEFKSVRTVILVAIGGALGAMGRHLLSQWLHHRFAVQFPIGTLAANLIGCFLIGVLIHGAESPHLPDWIRPLMITGFLGALTTFSTFTAETVRCHSALGIPTAAANILLNVGVGLAAFLLGHSLSKWAWG
ncbi:MAG: fluoride efflux transporter CrcB [Pirellulaceae bacterium]